MRVFDQYSKRALSILVGMLLVYILLGLWLDRRIGAGTVLQISWFSTQVPKMLAAYMLVLFSVHLFVKKLRNGGRPFSRESLYSSAKWVFNADRLRGVPYLLLIPPLMTTFSSFKRHITDIQPFYLDSKLFEIDRALHLGADPWSILHPVIGHPIITKFIDLIYVSWYSVLTLFIVAVAWSATPRLRARFFLSYSMCWIVLGSALAILMSSAGPCFLDEINGVDSAYEPLFEYLHTVSGQYPLVALELQAHLWDAFEANAKDLVSGISAMPSIHVAVAFLIALTARKINRFAGALAYSYSALILIGSVHLGWHYAIDGYASIVLMIPIWRLSDIALGTNAEAILTARSSDP
jgi:hypothetical protein